MSPQESWIEILVPSVKELGGGAFGRRLGREGGALQRQELPPRRPPRAPSPVLLWGRAQEPAVCEPGNHSHQALGFGLPCLQNDEK